MPKENVNQHYVPQSFMEAWADDHRRVAVYHLGQRREVARNSLEKTCADDYFYSTNTAVEKRLGELNGCHMQVINHIRDGGSLLGLHDQERSLLKSFVSVQRMRTEQMREGVYASGEDLQREYLEYWYADQMPDRETLEMVVDYKVDERMVSAHHLILQHGILGFLAFRDLGMVLLINETEQEFICSDAPVVFDNPRFKDREDLSYAGIANTGLVVYCPISPDRTLLLYDTEAYKVTAPRRDRVEVTDPSVIEDLNYLQLANANDIAFYNEASEEYIKKIHRRVDEAEEEYQVTHEYEFRSGYSAQQVYSPPEQIPTLTPTIDELVWTPREVEFRTQRRSALIDKQYNLAQKIRDSADTDEKHLLNSIDFCLQVHDES